jgi:hypothetical protein
MIVMAYGIAVWNSLAARDARTRKKARGLICCRGRIPPAGTLVQRTWVPSHASQQQWLYCGNIGGRSTALEGGETATTATPRDGKMPVRK